MIRGTTFMSKHLILATVEFVTCHRYINTGFYVSVQSVCVSVLVELSVRSAFRCKLCMQHFTVDVRMQFSSIHLLICALQHVLSHAISLW